MCGIVGYISSEKWNNKEALKSLYHRGPDNTGEFTLSTDNKHIFLGHTRLSIQDLSNSGNQPMQSEDENLIIVYNGEVYNFKELKNKYFKQDIFHSNTDTEVILKLYQKFENSFVQHLNGAFAIALYDKKQNKLHLFRDRLGIKPLYIFKNKQTIAFASELKAFKALGLPFVFDEGKVQNYLVFKYLPKNQTLIKNIDKLPPASHVTVCVNSLNISTNCFWQPTIGKTVNIQFNDAKEELRSLLQSAVNYRLIADVQVGNFLSGGVDSSVIASFLKDNRSIMHYCAVKDKKDIKKEGTTSDAEYARMLAEKWHLPFTEIAIGSNNTTRELIRKTVYYGDDLIADGSQIPSYLITKEASKTSRVILSGMGADELFFGYAGHQLVLLDQYLSKIPFHQAIAGFFKKLHVGKGKFKAFKRYLVKLGKYHQNPLKYGFYNIVGDYQNALFILNKNDESSLHIFKQYFTAGKSPFIALHEFEKDNFLQKNLNYLDRMSMANHVENRVPFLDHRIAEFAWQLPRNYKLTNTLKTKYILKQAFANELPSGIINRRKAGFGMPLRSIFSDEQKINELIDWNWINETKLFNQNNLQIIIQNHINGVEDNSALIYAVISLQEWYKTWIEN
jgi:asparagine synthase (glutamine-hydrolysing)